MPNIGRNAVAQSIGTVNRMEPPQSEMKNALRMMTDGMEMSSVVVWKNALTVVPMPVSHMWCAQTMKDKNPITSTEKTSDLYPQSGLRELFARISATIPNAGRINTYTSGCPRNQNKCCHNSGLPPPLMWTSAP